MLDFKNIDRDKLRNILLETDFTLRPTIGIDNNNTFGIEIEFENVFLDRIKNIGKWTLDKDESVTTYKCINDDRILIGGELVSPILTDSEITWIDIKNKCKKLVSLGACISDYTGGHIHIGSQILGNNPNNIARFLKQWELFEHIIYRFSYGYTSIPRKNINMFAENIGSRLKRVRNSKRGYSQFESYYDWIQYFHTHWAPKTTGANLKRYKGYEPDVDNTIEIRCPNGTLDPIIWQNNINFFTKFMISCQEEKCDEELIDYLLCTKFDYEYRLSNFGLIDIEKAIILCDMIFDNEMDKLLFLKQYLKVFEKDKEKVKSKN